MSALTTYPELEQGTDEWLAARCGIVTASVIGQLITQGSPDTLSVGCPRCGADAWEPCISSARKIPTPIKTCHDERASAASVLPPVIKPAENDTSRGLTMALVAERITGHVEPTYPSRAMERGTLDEPYARETYAEHYAPVDELGFMVREHNGWRVGYSPDGLVGDDGLIEIKSRDQKIQLRTFLADSVPAENIAQIQCGLWVSGRSWLDYVSYSGGMPLYVRRVYPDPLWHAAIIDTVAAFEDNAALMIANYRDAAMGRPLTERIDHFPEIVF